MRSLRRSCVVIIAFGGFLLATPRDSSFATIPFPAAGLSAKITAHIAHDANYHLVAAMPKANDELGLSEESVPCSLEIVFTRSGYPPITNRIAAISRYAEFGFARIQYYKSGPWPVRRGEYEIEINNLRDCPAAIARGATLTIEEERTQVTEAFLARMLRRWSGAVLFCAGLLGLVWSEFRRNKKMEIGAGRSDAVWDRGRPEP
jgi:hypothetical protein